MFTIRCLRSSASVIVITCYAHRGKGFKLISFTIKCLSVTLHLRHGWDPRTKVLASAARAMYAKEFVIE